jgi:hypothetical protein
MDRIAGRPTPALVAQFSKDVRLQMAVDGYLAGHFETVSRAAHEWDAPYRTAVRRVNATKKSATTEPPAKKPAEIIASLTTEQRVQRAVDGFKRGEYHTKRAAAQAWNAPYRMTVSRLRGAHSRTENASSNTKLDSKEELALQAWIVVHIETG